MRIYPLNKTVLILRNNAEKFLSGLTTNTLDAPRNAFVSVHGRIIATFEQQRIEDDAYLIVIEKNFYEPFLAHADRYLKLNRTTLELKEWFVYFDIEASSPLAPGEFAIPQKKGQLFISVQNYPTSVSLEEFTLFRLENQIALQGVDYTDEFLLNVSDDEFVSYTKGCFLGQEPIAKVHNRSKPTWKLSVRFEDECAPEERAKMTSKVLDPKVNRVRGFTFVRNI